MPNRITDPDKATTATGEMDHLAWLFATNEQYADISDLNYHLSKHAEELQVTYGFLVSQLKPVLAAYSGHIEAGNEAVIEEILRRR